MRDFEAAYGREADEDSAIPFAVCQGVEQGVRGANSVDNAEVSAWLAARTKDSPVKTVLGDFYWDERGLAIDRSPLLVQWQDQELEFVYPTKDLGDLAEDIVHPRPDWN